ncbi:proteobacterial dedicated sortase system histidine kinase [Sedimenticola selenatireducens]|uniref:histidine kinase n=1 Tax=Sedimenticola selenatireducens TaxID=191960 RepID=A0A558DXN8_9GAMM|nr:proteobacterial dedicated sortase system histidine kinase [Sedimenticola selenatireducens]TVO70749.1 proteobacterial dedicated sortase system histidine kinase [Sedimenticola selenatireducens]TVT65669.1 MAG: proteobacterial dedicated sortase system histidine kinase [Sedimenticola selenatireducens]
MNHQRSFFRSIRFKLLLVSLTLLAIPWAGYRYIQETERFLRQTQETMLLGTAQAVAAILHNSPTLLTTSNDRKDDSDEPLIYLNPLTQSIQLDGYSEDWLPYLGNIERYPEQGEWQFESILGEYGSHLYLFIRIKDDRVLHLPPGATRMDLGDSVRISIQQASGQQVDYRIATTAPGWVTAQQMPTRKNDPYPVRREDRIQGEWQTSEHGYTLELRIPQYLVGDRIALSVSDLDDPTKPETAKFISTVSDGSQPLLGRIIRPDPEIGRMIGGLQHENARIWVLNRQQLVLARRGRLQPVDDAITAEDMPLPSPLQPLLRLILDQPSHHFEDEFSRSARLKGGEIEAALSGQPQTRRRHTPDEKAVILSAAWPIESDHGVVGAVLVEQSTNEILTLQNQALEKITGITLMLFLFTGLAILGFATLLTRRIRHLSSHIEAAVTPDGRIQGRLKPDQAEDEIGDLSRSFSSVLNRLSEYNRYLEAMASRLAHEFRTPLTIVKSSLENLNDNSDPEAQSRYIQRAEEGVSRLGLILHRMREATRLEQQLIQTEIETFDLNAMLEMALEGYRQAFSNVTFNLKGLDRQLFIKGAPDLISQALDKLISNAVDFHLYETTIELILTEQSTSLLRLAVRNQGPVLPPGMEQELFASMVSIRESKQGEPHLGLGLYLVRLISEFHGGHTEARNLPSGKGVEFSLVLPILKTARPHTDG